MAIGDTLVGRMAEFCASTRIGGVADEVVERATVSLIHNLRSRWQAVPARKVVTYWQRDIGASRVRRHFCTPGSMSAWKAQPLPTVL